ncbi:Ger(x)C family spore germination protein [Clostridium tarantellae]|uniref:Ger(X)C family spore germination protein n=1 Tax=Clostridium tarantellae TaxID=39493 RepID=A0A6I1ML71_9CLOT|nr:Ger(x)C family spore germination protein [Clostridium tarantellae]MPQ43724.1 Ger(x)C family spore germination protein [Clostridium tarantellae]
MTLKKKLIRLIMLLSVVVSLCGCYNYRDINKVTFVTSVIFDENDIGDIEIYLDSVKPYRSANDSSDKGKRIVYKGKGKTVLEAMKDINMISSSKVDFTQCKSYIFTEKASKSGIKKYMDAINKSQEFSIRPYMFVLFGNVEELLQKVEVDEEYLGVFIDELVHKMNKSPRVITLDANHYLDGRTNYNNLLILGALNLRDDLGEKRLELSGGALFKDERMIKKINSTDAMAYNFLTNKVNQGTLEVLNPQDPNSYITLEIDNSKTKTKIEYDKERIKLIKDLKIKCYIGESQGRLLINNKDVIPLIEAAEEQVLKQFLQNVFEVYKGEGIDIVNVQKLFSLKYPKEVLDKAPILITDLEVNVDVQIEGSSVTGSTY